MNLDLKKLCCKNDYKLTNKESTVVPTSVTTWQKHIPEVSANWQQGFSRLYVFSKDNYRLT